MPPGTSSDGPATLFGFIRTVFLDALLGKTDVTFVFLCVCVCVCSFYLCSVRNVCYKKKEARFGHGSCASSDRTVTLKSKDVPTLSTALAFSVRLFVLVSVLTPVDN